MEGFMLVIGGIFGVIGAFMAQNRGRNPVIWFVLCFPLGIIGVLALACVGKSPEMQKREKDKFREKYGG